MRYSESIDKDFTQSSRHFWEEHKDFLSEITKLSEKEKEGGCMGRMKYSNMVL